MHRKEEDEKRDLKEQMKIKNSANSNSEEIVKRSSKEQRKG